MGHERFDALTRLLAARGSRRGAFGALLGMLVAGHDLGHGAATGRGKGKGRGKAKSQGRGKKSGAGGARIEATATRCCGTKSCAKPTAGSNRYECNFAGMNLSGRAMTGVNFGRIDGRKTNFSNANVKGSNFGSACLHGAIFTGANVSSANFDRACLFGADFTGARNLNVSVNVATALLCKTRLADGSLSDRDCARASTCCGECSADGDCDENQVCCNGTCRDGDCCQTRDCGAAGDVCADFVCRCGAAAACSAPDVCCGSGASATCENTRNDPDHCGRCGVICDGKLCNDRTCANGACGLDPIEDGPAPGCNEPGQTCCDGECKLTYKDNQHCGGCGIACPANATCVDGTCQCDRDYKPCGDSCILFKDCCTDDVPNVCPTDEQCCIGTCIPEAQCCTDADCEKDQACDGGTCVPVICDAQTCGPACTHCYNLAGSRTLCGGALSGTSCFACSSAAGCFSGAPVCAVSVLTGGVTTPFGPGCGFAATQAVCVDPSPCT